MNWSGSKLALRRLCGWAFAEDHVRMVPRPPHPALAGGGAAHEGIAALVRASIEGDLIDIYAIARATAHGTSREYADALSVLQLMQEELAEDPPPFDPGSVLYIEERLKLPIGPHVFDGQADLVERRGRTCRITDWKTHWRPESQEAFEADPQLKRYALLVDHAHPGEFDAFEIRKRFVRYRGAVREMVLEPHHLAVVKWDLVQEIEEAEAAVAAGHFEATPGDWCTICSRAEACPVVKDFLAHGFELVMEDDAAAQRAAAVVRAIDAHSARLKARLKGYLGGDHPTGRVELAGGSYGFGPAKHKSAAVDDVFEVFEAHERPVRRSALRVDVDQLNRALNSEPGDVRRAMRAVIHEYEQADCRYRRGDKLEDEDVVEEPEMARTA